MDNQGLKQYIENLIKRGASAAEIARKCGVSDAAMSQFRSGKYGAKENALAEKIASALNFYENTWKIVDSVTSYRQIRTAFNVAKRNRKWICISSRSGSGKTQSLVDLYNLSMDNSVIYLKCRKWTARKFLTKLAICLGESVTRYMDNDDLLELVVSHFNRMADKNPVLILDDAGKLSHSAICTFIPLYDDTLHRLGVLVAGTETLERNIKRYVGRIEGYDEVDSRFGRNYISLLGATKKDTCAMCEANGITDKALQAYIWGKLDKQLKQPSEDKSRQVYFCDDLREIAVMIENELIHQQLQNGEIV
jgi:DNA transposition AAA+ family ATPase